MILLPSVTAVRFGRMLQNLTTALEGQVHVSIMACASGLIDHEHIGELFPSRFCNYHYSSAKESLSSWGIEEHNRLPGLQFRAFLFSLLGTATRPTRARILSCLIAMAKFGVIAVRLIGLDYCRMTAFCCMHSNLPRTTTVSKYISLRGLPSHLMQELAVYLAAFT